MRLLLSAVLIGAVSPSLAFANIFLSEPLKVEVCSEVVSNMAVEDGFTFNSYMMVCLDSEKTQFCTPRVNSEQTAVSTRYFIEYKILNFQPTSDHESESYLVKAYPDSGLFLRQRATGETRCE